MVLLVVVLLSGIEVRLNPHEIVALVEARKAEDKLKHYAPEVRCVVEATNGRSITTREECSSIEKRLQAIKDAP